MGHQQAKGPQSWLNVYRIIVIPGVGGTHKHFPDVAGPGCGVDDVAKVNSPVSKRIFAKAGTKHVAWVQEDILFKPKSAV